MPPPAWPTLATGDTETYPDSINPRHRVKAPIDIVDANGAEPLLGPTGLVVSELMK